MGWYARCRRGEALAGTSGVIVGDFADADTPPLSWSLLKR